MGRRSRKSKRKLNSLFTMLLLTAVLMIVSTYAWFSVNREVTITGITAKVQAAEGLQISLDAVTWGSTVEVSQTALAKINTDAGETINNFIWPEELEPVSTDGTIEGSDVKFCYGEVSADGATLSAITAAPPSGGKYISFDVYLKNSSSLEAGDRLQLSDGSYVRINTAEGGKDNTGLENCVRAGLLLYSTTKGFTDSQADIISMSPGTPLFAVWEPNYTVHIPEVVQNDGRIGAVDTAFATLAMKPNSYTFNIKPVNTTSATASKVDANGAVIAESEAAYMSALNTITSPTGTTTKIKNITSADSAQTQLMLKQNAVMKARMYIWLEGQDPDCNDTASTGRAFDIQVKLRKPKTDDTTSGAGADGTDPT